MRFLVITLFFLTSVYSKETLTFGFLSQNLFATSQDIDLTSKIWEEHYNKLGHFEGKVLSYSEPKALLEDYLNKQKLDTIALSPSLFFEYKQQLLKNSQHPWTLNISSHQFIQYYLIKNKNSSNTFENSRFIYKDGDGNGLLWLDKLSLEGYKKRYIEVFSSHTRSLKQAKVFFELFFEKADYAVVARSAYDTMMELNPQLKERISIVKKSEPIFGLLIAMSHKDIPKKRMQLIQEQYLALSEKIAGRNTFSVTDQYLIKAVPFEHFSEYEKFYRRYKTLLKEHGYE